MSEQSSPTLQGQKKKKEHPEWHAPVGTPSQLMINNSLTSTKNAFTPISGGKAVTWYICGPTVYDASHMGHARSYISFDILRRIMTDYLGYDVQYIMNITDIDDKIILRSRDQNITHSELSKKWENSFFEDLKQLNVLPPDALTRVTEYVPQIVEYVEKIISNGYAYESNGSVYFDVAAYSKVHDYGKLDPNAVGNEKLNNEGEGALSLAANDKRGNNDFALWKKSKEGEPVWNSPWGEGRPGWHIECSAMASDILGQHIDIHSGGEDLKFPHHDNELAQSEAHYGCKQWINYFIHAGHLLIDGLKMSKSLKNFITIQDVLKKYTSRQIRMLFLVHRYDAPMNYSIEAMTDAIGIERIFTEFFHSVKAAVRDYPMTLPQNWEQDDKELNAALLKAKEDVHQFILDNFNTTDAIRALQTLIGHYNNYTNKCTKNARNPRLSIITAVGDYVTKILRVFGVVDTPAMGFGSVGGNVEEVLGPVLDVMLEFRNEMRALANTENPRIAILQLCDKFRDVVLPPLGVKIDDKAGKSTWKIEDKETLRKEMELKKEIEAKKAEDRALKALKEKEKFELSKITPAEFFKRKEVEDAKYTAFDEQGIPTHADGAEITKSQRKKLESAHKDHVKNHTKYLETEAKNATTKQ
eukprot:gene8030-9434_t